MAIVYQEVCSHSSRAEVVDAAGAVGHVAQDEDVLSAAKAAGMRWKGSVGDSVVFCLRLNNGKACRDLSGSAGGSEQGYWRWKVVTGSARGKLRREGP